MLKINKTFRWKFIWFNFKKSIYRVWPTTDRWNSNFFFSSLASYGPATKWSTRSEPKKQMCAQNTFFQHFRMAKPSVSPSPWSLEQQFLFHHCFPMAQPLGEAQDRNQQKNSNKCVFSGFDFFLRWWQGRCINNLSFLIGLFSMALASNQGTKRKPKRT